MKRSSSHLTVLVWTSATTSFLLFLVLAWRANQSGRYDEYFLEQLGDAWLDRHCDRLPMPRYFDERVNISTALASYPRSGNSMVRRMLEDATGLLTSSVYCDRSLRKTFVAECNKSAKFLVKTHYPVNLLVRHPDPQSHWRSFHRVIHVVRNPIDAIISYHHFYSTKNHTARLDATLFRRKLSKDRLAWYVRKYKSHVSYWSSVPLPRIIIRYEDLMHDTHTHLTRMVSFLLDLPSTPWSPNTQPLAHIDDHERKLRIQCAMRNSLSSPYHLDTQRRHYGSVFPHLALLDSSHVTYILAQLRKEMCMFGYDMITPSWIRMYVNATVPSGEVWDLKCAEFEADVDFQEDVEFWALNKTRNKEND